MARMRTRTYKATTAVGIASVEDGALTERTFAEGDTVAGLSPAQFKRLVALGAIVEATDKKE